MRAELKSAQKLVLLSITRCFRITSTAAVQVLNGALPLDLQVEKESFLVYVLRLNRDLRYGPIPYSVGEIQRSVDS